MPLLLDMHTPNKQFLQFRQLCHFFVFCVLHTGTGTQNALTSGTCFTRHDHL